MVLAYIQSLHVHGTARSRPRARAALRRRALSDELRQPGSSLYTRRRRTSALAAASRRWLRCLAAGRGPTGILQAGVCQIGLELKSGLNQPAFRWRPGVMLMRS